MLCEQFPGPIKAGSSETPRGAVPGFEKIENYPEVIYGGVIARLGIHCCGRVGRVPVLKPVYSLPCSPQTRHVINDFGLQRDTHDDFTRKSSRYLVWDYKCKAGKEAQTDAEGACSTIDPRCQGGDGLSGSLLLMLRVERDPKRFGLVGGRDLSARV